MRVQRDLEVGPELLQIVGIELRCRLVFKHEVVAADAHDAVDLAGQDKAARRGAGRGIDDCALEGFLQRDDLKLLRRIARHVTSHHRRGVEPVPLLVFVLRPARAQPVNPVEHLGKIPLAVPQLKAVVDE